jgi:hypothetical protein
MLFALLQEETTGIAGAAGDAKNFAENFAEQPITIFTVISEFLQHVYHYVHAPD